MKKTNKETKLIPLYKDDEILLPYGSYARIARSLKLSSNYVSMVLNPDLPEWNEAVYKAAHKILIEAAKAEKELSEQAANAIKQWRADFEAATQIMKEINNG